MIRLVSWNVNGIRANIKKGFWENIKLLESDIIGIQETKSDFEIMTSGVMDNSEFDFLFHSCSMKKGYSGVATLFPKDSISKTNTLFEKNGNLDQNQNNFQIVLNSHSVGLGDDIFDVEGRVVTTKFKVVNPKTGIKDFVLINAYYPQGGRDGRVPYKIQFYQKMYDFVKSLKAAGENVILCGDFNTTVNDIDLARPKENRKTTGCLPEEREALNLFLNNGFVDTFRYLYPNKESSYSYWDQITRARERNVGWRIDYFIVDQKLLPFLKEAYIWDNIYGSDHCPVGVDLDL